MSIKKAKVIAKAFLSDLPIGEDWYEERLAICNTCEYNTKNKNKSELSITDRIKISTGVCDNSNHCTACGCCIERKCSVKSEVCGLQSIGKTPKWTPIESFSDIDDKLSVENLSPNKCRLKFNENRFIFDFGTVSENKISVSFKLTRKGGLDIVNQRAGCSCTVSDVQKIDDNTQIFNVDISTKSFRANQETNKTLFVTIRDRSNNTKSVDFLFKITKNG